jgi:hypothetical protein
MYMDRQVGIHSQTNMYVVLQVLTLNASKAGNKYKKWYLRLYI